MVFAAGQSTAVANTDDSRTRNLATYPISSIVCKNWKISWQLNNLQFYLICKNWISSWQTDNVKYRNSHPEVFLRKDVLKICSKLTAGHPCWSAISIKLLCNFIEIALRHGCSPVNLLHIFRTPFPRNTSGWLLLKILTLSLKLKKELVNW